MGINVESKLDNSRNKLQELGNALSNLVNSSPDIFNNPEINVRLEALRQAHQEATQRLEKPNFSIATIGTTSSGKSTIVNALIGRKIAPIEAGEMSGGVLTLQHSEERKLIIEETEGATWETGISSDLSDEAFYECIRSVMFAYHSARKKQQCIAPRLTAYVPLLPAANSKILGLPSGVGVELIDLPGLKSVQDRDNLKVIQERVHKAFSIVALDYGQVDEQHRKRLLEELRQVVKYLQGRTDSMVFILNRIDLHGVDDLPIFERIARLREEIQEVLSLPEPPNILPFNARLLYYAQCAWGAVSLAQAPSVDQNTRLKFLKAMFHDCQGTISQYTENNWDLDDWFRDLRREVSRGSSISDEQVKQVVQYALQWSGGSQLWTCLRQRIQESFSELVILPALIDVFNCYDSLAETLDILIETKKISNQKEIEKQREKINQIRQDLSQNVKKINNSFHQEITDYTEALKTNDPDIRSRIIQDAAKKGRKGFQVIFDAVNEVDADLNQSLITLVRDALKNHQGSYEIEDKLQELVSPDLANDIARAYDNVSRRLNNNFIRESGYLIKRVRADDSKGIQEITLDEKYVRLLYHTMKQGLSARAEFLLQAQAKEFITALESLVEEQLTRLKYCLPDQDSSPLNIEQAVISELRKQLAQDLPNLPEKFFEIPVDIKQTDSQKEEVIDKKNKTVSYTEGSCFWKETKTKTVWEDIKGQVTYKELFLPDINMMAKQWSSGIEKGKSKLWDILCDWIIKRLNKVSDMFEKSVNDITDLAERVLQDQLKIIEENFEIEMQHLHNFESQAEALTLVRQHLEKEINRL